MPDTLIKPSLTHAVSIQTLPNAVFWFDVLLGQLALSAGVFIAVYPDAPAVWLAHKHLSAQLPVVSLDEDTMPHERRYALDALVSGKAKGLLTTANMFMHPDVEKVLPALKINALVINQAEHFTPGAYGPFNASRYARLALYLGQTRHFEASNIYLMSGVEQTPALGLAVQEIYTDISSEAERRQYSRVDPQIRPCLTAHQKLQQLRSTFSSFPKSLHIIVCRDTFEQKALHKHIPKAFLLLEALLTNRSQSIQSEHFQGDSIIICPPQLLSLLLDSVPETGYTVSFWQPLWSNAHHESVLGYFTFPALKQLPHVLQVLYCADDFQSMLYSWQRKADETICPSGIQQVKNYQRWLKQQALRGSKNLSALQKLKIRLF